MEFEWDDAKAQEDRAKHGVSFEVASTVFGDPRLVLAEDLEHSSAEPRYFAFGMVGGGVLTVRFTVHGSRREGTNHRSRLLEKGQGVL